MATPQTYTSTNDVSIPSSMPRDQGGSVSMGPFGNTELRYVSGLNADTQGFEEVQNLVALWCRATVAGLSTSVAGTPSTYYNAVTPRAALLRLQFIVNAMLSQPVG